MVYIIYTYHIYIILRNIFLLLTLITKQIAESGRFRHNHKQYQPTNRRSTTIEGDELFGFDVALQRRNGLGKSPRFVVGLDVFFSRMMSCKIMVGVMFHVMFHVISYSNIPVHAQATQTKLKQNKLTSVFCLHEPQSSHCW